MPIIKTNAPADIVAAISYQLGFDPQDSLVAVAVRGEQGRVGLMVRVDLGDAATAAADIASHIVQDGAHRCLLVAYTDDESAGRAAAAAVRDALAAGGVLGTPEWIVTPGRGLVLPDGQVLPTDAVRFAAVAAEYVARGLSAAESLEAAAYIAPATKSARATAARAARTWDEDPEVTITRCLPRLPNLTPTDCGRLAAAMSANVLARDALLLAAIDPAADRAARGIFADAPGARPWIDQLLTEPAAEPGERATQVADALTRIVAHVPKAHTPAPLTLLAILAWWQGSGAIARVRLERALDVDPNYRMALLFGDLLAAGRPPGWVMAQRRAQ